MQQRNYEFLCMQLRHAGFPAALLETLSRTLDKGGAEFQLDYPETFETGQTTVVLHFQKSSRSEFYFFTHFLLSMGDPLSGEAKPASFQRFPVFKNKSYTLREAYNLISGRSVLKQFTGIQGDPYRVWVQLDFSRTDDYGNYRFQYYYPHYGYDLTAAVEKFPIGELRDPAEKDRLLGALARGEREKATLLGEKQPRICYLEASPRFKSLKIFDESMQRLSNRALEARPAPGQNETETAAGPDTATATEARPPLPADTRDGSEPPAFQKLATFGRRTQKRPAPKKQRAKGKSYRTAKQKKHGI